MGFRVIGLDATNIHRGDGPFPGLDELVAEALEGVSREDLVSITTSASEYGNFALIVLAES